jgi:hypothetical protein
MKVRADPFSGGKRTLSNLTWLGALFCLRLAAQSDPLDSWTQVNPTPTGDTLTSVTFANGQYFAGGSAGRILVSADGVD